MCSMKTNRGKPYRGNEHIKARVDNRILSIEPEGRIKFLLSGPAGTGKTALGWIIAYRLMVQRIQMNLSEGRFFEILGEQIEGKFEWDEFMSQLKPFDTIFIDEIHVLQNVIGVEALFSTLADTGTPRYPLGQGRGWIDIPTTISWIGATTLPGELDPALRRRLEPELRIEAPSAEDLALIVKDQGMDIDDDAAIEIAKRSGGLPWQAINVYNEAKAVARVQKSTLITDEHAEQAFEIMGVDPSGLLPEDRTVIKVLLQVEHIMANGMVVHRMNEGALCAAAGVDRLTYKERVQPKLMRLGLLTTVGGQSLTERAVTEYHFLQDAP
jgi:Holliday junction DNA helicase RuvB